MSPFSHLLIVGDFFTPTDKYYQQALSGNDGLKIRKLFSFFDFPLSQLHCDCIFHFIQDKEIFDYKASKNLKAGWIKTPYANLSPQAQTSVSSFAFRLASQSPTCIIPIGDFAFRYLGGQGSLIKWRGSELQSTSGIRMIPTVPQNMWHMRPDLWEVIKRDLKKAITPPSPRLLPLFITNPTYHQVLEWLAQLQADLENSELPLYLTLDLETASQHITCLGLGYTKDPTHSLLCIPFTKNGLIIPYWTQAEEIQIIRLLRNLLTHHNIRIVGQNLFYDFQMIAHHWLFIPNFAYDTMLMHHLRFPWLEKSLAFQASLYCDHYVYWKEMHKSDEKED